MTKLSNDELAQAYSDMADVCARLASHYEESEADRPTQEQEPLWLTVARGELGTKEAPGARDNPRVVEYHGVTAAGPAPDSVPWCASFVGWCLKQAGVQGTRRKSARSYLSWGEPLKYPRLGCVVVLERGKHPAGHVGFYAGNDRILGGNQNNEVSIKPFEPLRVLGYRWPAGME